MPEANFDISYLYFWNSLITCTVNGVGILSAFAALSVSKSSKSRSTNVAAVLLAVILVILLGCYPIEWGYGTDRENYAVNFYRTSETISNAIVGKDSEFGFTLLNYILGRFLNVNQYFVAIAIVYICNYFIALRRMTGKSIYWLLASVVLSMGFTSYNLNTMRAGLALSFVMLALSMYPSKFKMLVCMVAAGSIHTSALIPSAMVLISSYYSNTRLYYILWLLAVPVSFVAGNFFNTLFSGIGDDSRNSYLTGTNDHYNIGFRIDFIIYSFVPMLIGGYYIIKRKFNDSFYKVLYSAYLLTNIFWILVIRANYSDRFAYLSWCFIPIVLVYPLLRSNVPVRSPGLWISAILLGETIFRSLL